MRIDNRTDDLSRITTRVSGKGDTVGDALANACAKANEAWGNEPWITVRQDRHGSSDDVWRVTLETVAARARIMVTGFELRVGDVVVSRVGGEPLGEDIAGQVLIDEPVPGTFLLDRKSVV